jgi:hypothetical protein
MKRGMAAAIGLLLGSCAVYGAETGLPPGPMPAVWDGGTPPHAGTLEPLRGNGGDLVLAAGIYQGDLVIEGNGNRVTGAGRDGTIVEGALVVRGDANVIGLLRVRGPSRVEGDENDLRGVAFDGGVDVAGEEDLVPAAAAPATTAEPER